MSNIRPGLNIEFFYHADYEQERFHALRSVVYDVQVNKIIIAQSAPAVLSSGINKRVVVTYLSKQGGQPERFGIPAKIADILPDYRLSAGKSVPALVLEQQGRPRSFNLRFQFRLRVPSSSDLTLHLGGTHATLIDVSIGGAMISGDIVKRMQQHERIKVKVGFAGQSFNLDAEVLRIWWADPGSSRKDLQFAALRFFNAPLLFENALAKTIFTIERQILAHETISSRH
jgi:hypothetical protein